MTRLHIPIPVAVLCLASLTTLSQAATYAFSPFQYPGASATAFASIDDGNRIVGTASIGPNGTLGLMLTAAGTITTITPAGYAYGAPASINYSQGIVGPGYNGQILTMFRDGNSGYGPISPDLTNQTISGINTAGNTVGLYTSASGATAVYAKLNGTYHTLLPPSCAFTYDPAINDFNTVVGSCVNRAGVTLGFSWSKGRYSFIQPPAGSAFLHPGGINKAGLIVGWYNDVSGFSHGFTLTGGVLTTVDFSAAGVTNTLITGVNSSGRIVGSYTAPPVSGAFSAVPH